MSDRGHGLVDLINVRDLGGLPTTDGRATRRALLYRSESFAAISEQDRATLVEDLKVSNVIDLRALIEVERQRPTWADAAGISYVNLPMSDGFDAIPESLSEQELEDLVPAKYLGYLAHAPANIVSAVESIADAAAEGRATIFACTYGKDRTGVLAMLVLELIGVERAAIIDDYLATATVMPVLMDRMRDDALHGPRILVAPAQVYEANRCSAEAFLHGLDERGGAEDWAIGAGLPRSIITRLREALVAA